MVELVETRRVCLGDVADFINGAAFKPEDWGPTGARIIRIQNLNDPSKPYNRTERLVPQKLHVRPGDLLVSWSASLGVFVWDHEDTALLNQHIFRVIPDDERVDKNYLRHMLSDALDSMKRHLHGATMMHVNRKEFLSTSIPLPPLDEQGRIAAILDKADELRTKRREALAHLDALTPSIFHSMFTGHEDLQTVVPLAEAVAPGTVVTYGIVQAGEEFPSGIPYIRTGDLTGGVIAVEKLRRTDPKIAAKFARSRVSAGDLVMSIRATVGTVAITPEGLEGANLTQGTARIAPGPDLTSEYLLEFLRSEATQRWIWRNVKGATFKEITLERLRTLPVAIPPLSAQRSFTNRVAIVERLKELHRKHLAELDVLFASLQHRAFKGEL